MENRRPKAVETMSGYSEGVTPKKYCTAVAVPEPYRPQKHTSTVADGVVLLNIGNSLLNPEEAEVQLHAFQALGFRKLPGLGGLGL